MTVLNQTGGTQDGIIIQSSKRSVFVVPDAATLALSAKLSGRVIVFPNLTADIIVSMPAEENGLEYWFQYGGAAADAHDWLIDTGANANYFVGGVTFVDLDSDVQSPVYSDGNSNSKFVVLVPEVGTNVHVVCDGTVWYINGIVCSATTPTMGDQ